MLRANTHSDAGRAHVHACFTKFSNSHTKVPVATLKVSDPGAGRAFVLKFGGDPQTAARHVDEAFLELRDGAGQWRPLEIEAGSGGSTRLRGQRPPAFPGGMRDHRETVGVGDQGEVDGRGSLLPEVRRGDLVGPKAAREGGDRRGRQA